MNKACCLLLWLAGAARNSGENKLILRQISVISCTLWGGSGCRGNFCRGCVSGRPPDNGKNTCHERLSVQYLMFFCWIFELFFVFCVVSLANLRHVSVAPPPADQHNLYTNVATSVSNLPCVPGPSCYDLNCGKNQKIYFCPFAWFGGAV